MLLRLFTVFSLAALAIGTWILISQERAAGPASIISHVDQMGFYLRGTVLTDYDENGLPAVRIAAARIQQAVPSNQIDLFDVQLDYQSPGGQRWEMLGDTGRVQPGGKQVQVTGNVRLRGVEEGRADAAIIHMDDLNYDVVRSEARTQSAVHIEFGKHLLNARGLVANLKEQTIRLESKVNGHFLP
jgi:LPS export ABC transporter protein LptC